MTNDGTQDPGPSTAPSDPVSGLVTGSRYETEPLTMRVAEPSKPDIAQVRAAMADMLDENSELNLDLVPLGGRPDEPTAEILFQASSQEDRHGTEPAETTEAKGETMQDSGADGPVPTPLDGIPAQREAEPDATAATVPDLKAPPPATRGEKLRRLPALLRRERPPRPPSAVGRKSSAPSVAAIAVLLLVIAVLVIVFIWSFIDTIESVFA